MAEIRAYEPEDAEQAAGLIAGAMPQPTAITATTMRHWVDGAPTRAQTRVWVAEDGGELIGWGDARLRWAIADEGITDVWVTVRADRRGQGIGSRLAVLVEGHVRELGARKISTFVREDEPGSLAFAVERGYAETRREYSWILYLEGISLDAPELPDGFRLVRLQELRARERELFDLYDAAHRDMPADHPYALEFDEWRTETLENPELDFEASSVVLAGDRLVSFAWITSAREGGGGMHELTGTLPEYRGRGLARAAKVATIRWAAETGLRFLVTSNDDTNAPMLALNERLGYEPRTTIIELAKDV